MSSRILDKVPNPKALHHAHREDYADFPPSPTNHHHHHHRKPSPFLNLPRELRDEIYTYFLSAHRPPPPSPPFSGPRIYRLEQDENENSDENETTPPPPHPLKDIAYPTTLPSNSLHSLLQTSRSIRAEILQLIDKRNTSQPHLPAHLDIMVTGYVLYPLWMLLPALPSRTSTSLDLTVTLRIFSAEAFRASDGWPRQPGVVFRSLLKLLNQFVGCGPGFASLPSPSPRHSSRHEQQQQQQTPPPINLLTLRLSNQDIYTPRMFPPAVHETVRMGKALAFRGDFRRIVRRVKVVVEDSEGRFEGLEGREWEFEVLGEEEGEGGDDGLAARRREWEDWGFWAKGDGAWFDFGG